MKKPRDRHQEESGFRSESFYSSCKIKFGLASPCCTIVESISDGVFTVDFEKRITFFNRAAEFITGFKAEEAIGQYCFDIFRANSCHDKCPMDAATAGHPQINVCTRIIDKSGEQKPICVNTALLYCGIHRTYKAWLIRNGITVMENQRGVAMEVIKKWLNKFGSDGHDPKRASSFVEKA